jgi:hypothetical protein
MVEYVGEAVRHSLTAPPVNGPSSQWRLHGFKHSTATPPRPNRTVVSGLWSPARLVRPAVCRCDEAFRRLDEDDASKKSLDCR